MRPLSPHCLLENVLLDNVRHMALAVCLMLAVGARAQYVNFESAQMRPICLSPDGTRLFAVNTPDGRLSVFDVSNAANAVPVLIREIAVGVEPVSVNAVSNEEAWVVNEVSDSVSVVSVAAGAVVTTLACKDEPGDVVFANGRAFVSCSRSNLVRVFDLATRAALGTIPLEGSYPRSLAVSADGARIYAAFKLSGNRTTLLPPNLAPPQPPPTNGSLPPPPQVGLIVNADDARLNPSPNIPDNDVAEIDTATLGVMRYFKGTGTVNFAVAVRPASSEVWVANTEARNLVRFEPAQKGHSVDNRVTRVDTAGAGTVTAFDLNPGVDYNLFPNNAALATALAQPAAIAFTPDGAAFWVASFGTDRVARVNAATGAVIARIETGPTTGAAADPRNKRGPRGLALHAANQRLYVLNRFTNTISIVSTASESVVAEIPAGSFDPTPAVIRQGRGFLYDARLSGNGTQSCASCHIDGDRDDIAWDLGDPGGSMQTVTTLGGTVTFQMHPMKGPMNTQTLRGIVNTDPLHWRGDRADFTAFNPAFSSLLGGAQLNTADMNAYRDFINTVVFEPNPNQNLDRTMPALFPPGDPNAGNPNTGRNTFLNDTYQPNLRCNTCHSLPTGTNRVIISAAALQESQNFKVPHLRNVYQKLQFKGGAPAVSLSGFGIVHDGQAPDLMSFLSRPVFGTFANDTTRKRNLNAFVQCFDTGTAPSVGYTRTVTSATLAGSSADWSVLEAQAVAASCDLVVKLFDANGRRGFVYRPGTNDYLPDRAALAPVTRAAIETMITNGATASVMGVPPTSGQRLGVDRDGDTVRDGDEPMPALGIASASGTPQLAWPAADSALVLEFSNSLTPANWQPVTEPRAAAGGSIQVLDPGAGTRRYYRLRQP
jgi:YVTN family beta-propeller protein